MTLNFESYMTHSHRYSLNLYLINKEETRTELHQFYCRKTKISQYFLVKQRSKDFHWESGGSLEIWLEVPLTIELFLDGFSLLHIATNPLLSIMMERRNVSNKPCRTENMRSLSVKGVFRNIKKGVQD